MNGRRRTEYDRGHQAGRIDGYFAGFELAVDSLRRIAAALLETVEGQDDTSKRFRTANGMLCGADLLGLVLNVRDKQIGPIGDISEAAVEAIVGEPAGPRADGHKEGE